MSLLFLLAIPLLVAALATKLLPGTITTKEFLLQAGISVAVMVGAYHIARWQSVSDTEYLNGRITEKTHGMTSCCHCTEVCQSRDKNGNCSSYKTVCDHISDEWFSLETTIGTIPIESCTSWGAPSVWSNAVVGEPATLQHSYSNYLLADPESLLSYRKDDATAYPTVPETYDTYRRAPVVGGPPAWQAVIQEANADLGPLRQVDIMVVVVSGKGVDYGQGLEAKWVKGPKNSFVVVLNVEDDTITWSYPFSFSKVEELKIELRDSLQGKKVSDPVPQMIVASVKDKFHRTSMETLHYLMESATPQGGWLFGLYVLTLILSGGLTALMHHHDIFKEGTQKWDPYRTSRKRNKWTSSKNTKPF